jgi:hypothetical protein
MNWKNMATQSESWMSWKIKSQAKLVSSSLKYQSLILNHWLKRTRLKHLLELVQSHQLKLSSHLAQQVWTQLKFNSSTPFRSQQRLKKVKSKSQRISWCWSKDKKLVNPKLFYSKNWERNHSHMVWKCWLATTMDLF